MSISAIISRHLSQKSQQEHRSQPTETTAPLPPAETSHPASLELTKIETVLDEGKSSRSDTKKAIAHGDEAGDSANIDATNKVAVPEGGKADDASEADGGQPPNAPILRKQSSDQPPHNRDNARSPHYSTADLLSVSARDRELPRVCSSSHVFGVLPGNRAQAPVVPFPQTAPRREIDHVIRKQILDLNISVLFDYADKDDNGTIEADEFTALLGMIELPSVRVRLQQLLPEIERLESGIDCSMFSVYLMQVYTDTHNEHNVIDEAAVGVATLIKKIRKNARYERARRRGATRKQGASQARRRKKIGNNTKKRKKGNGTVYDKPRKKSVPSTMYRHIERKKTRKQKEVAAIEDDDGKEDFAPKVGLGAFLDDVEDTTKSRWKQFKEKMMNDIIVVNKMHIPIILILLWVLLGTLLYFLVQQWRLSQSFYFMAQAGFSVGFGAFSEDMFISKNMPGCVKIYSESSWDWLDRLQHNNTIALSDVASSGTFDTPIADWWDLKPPVTWGLDPAHRHVEICAKWPWEPYRSGLSKILSVVLVFLGSAFSGWILSLIGEHLVAKRNIWYEEQEKLHQETLQKNRVKLHQETLLKLRRETSTLNAPMRDKNSVKAYQDKQEKNVALERKIQEEKRKQCCQAVCDWFFENKLYLMITLYVVIGLVYGMAAEGWDIVTSLEFAVTAVSTGGLQAPGLIDSDAAMVFMGCYVLLGVPIYALALGDIAAAFMKGRERAEDKYQLRMKAEYGTAKEFQKASIALEDIAGKMQGSRLDFNRYMMWELMRMGKIELDLLKDLRDRYDELDIDGDGWLDIEEFNIVLTFEKYTTDPRGLKFEEFKKLVDALLHDRFVISKHNAYKTPLRPFINETWMESINLPEDGRLERISSELWKQFCAFSNGGTQSSPTPEPGVPRFLKRPEFFQWTNAHSVLKLYKPADKDEVFIWERFKRKWETHCESKGMTHDGRQSLMSQSVFNDPDDQKDKKAFSVDLSLFVVHYEIHRTHPSKNAFKRGQEVRIVKESAKKGWVVRVVDPCWNGLVKVRCFQNDDLFRAYNPKDLRPT